MEFRGIAVATMSMVATICFSLNSIPVLASDVKTDTVKDQSLSIAEELDAVDEQKQVAETERANKKAGLHDVDYVATLIESEAGNVESINGRVAVALTGFQRVESDGYPDNIYAVVEQPYQYADLVGYYSDKSYVAAKVAISLWESGNADAVLPDGFVYFFGYNKQNWFYRINDDNIVEFYALQGQTITDEIYAAYKDIVGIKSKGYTVV